jgi:hypothetical protein
LGLHNHTYYHGFTDSRYFSDSLYVISLLGKKTSGFSEFDYYPFRSSREAGAKPTFQEWLDNRYGPRFVVHEFPTVDAAPEGIQADVLEAVTHDVLKLIEKNCTVVLVDSAGARRTTQVRKEIYKMITNEPVV